MQQMTSADNIFRYICFRSRLRIKSILPLVGVCYLLIKVSITYSSKTKITFPSPALDFNAFNQKNSHHYEKELYDKSFDDTALNNTNK